MNVLLALVPYSRQNMKIMFAPNQFFYDLSKSTNKTQGTLRSAYLRGKNNGLIIQDQKSKQIRLTKQGLNTIEPFVAKKLKGHARLMIIFDIPEYQAGVRRQLRSILKAWQFKQIQKSVWVTNYDYVDSLKLAIKELNLSEFVQLYECAKVFP